MFIPQLHVFQRSLKPTSVPFDNKCSTKGNIPSITSTPLLSINIAAHLWGPRLPTSFEPFLSNRNRDFHASVYLKKGK
jgi:hypothetical protein